MCLFLTICGSGSSYACSNSQGKNGVPQLRVPQGHATAWEKQDYFIGLLRLIIAETAVEYGPCEVIPTDNLLTRMRSLALINNRLGVDLFWATTSVERETLLRPIRIPLLKGLMGYKILLINPGDQKLFSKIQTLADLRKLRAGVGTDWPDHQILRANGIPVISSTNYESLFKMLSAGRFDFFPRGAHEVLTEQRSHPEINLHVEQDLVLVYPAPVYFFVNIDNLALQQRLEKGLRKIIANGTFDEYFYKHNTIVDAIQTVGIDERRKIYLTNPLLPDTVPLGVDRYWLYPWYTSVPAE